MEKTVLAHKVLEHGTVRDTLSKETDAIRAVGYSIFGINESEKLPETIGSRWVTILYGA
jgi:hypothetical protein